MASVLESKRLHIPTFDLQCIKEFPIDKMSDALVARLKVSKEEKRTLIPIFYDLYDFTRNITDTHNQITIAHSDYNRKMDSLQHEWDSHYMEFSRLIKDYLVSTGLPELEKRLFIKIDTMLNDFHRRVTEAGGIFRRYVMSGFVMDIADVFTNAPATLIINEAVTNFYKIRVIHHGMESLHADMIKCYQTVIGILSQSKDHLSKLVSFYEQHKIKCIFSLSNKVA
jgi:hypothetical protein